MYPSWKYHRGLKDSRANQESDLDAVKDERRPAAWAGRMSPNVDIAAVDLSLNMPTCPSVSMDPSFSVLPTCPIGEKSWSLLSSSKHSRLYKLIKDES